MYEHNVVTKYTEPNAYDRSIKKYTLLSQPKYM